MHYLYIYKNIYTFFFTTYKHTLLTVTQNDQQKHIISSEFQIFACMFVNKNHDGFLKMHIHFT